jgi:hypothetical protein
MPDTPFNQQMSKYSDVREYDLFEVRPDGSPIWRTSVFGMKSTEQKLLEFSTTTGHRCFAINLADPTEIVKSPSAPASQPH